MTGDFWSKVDKREADECWPWLGTVNHRGYGRLSNKPATHIALSLDGRPRPVGAMALHSCDNPPCCNPAHLRWGTAADNVADMVSRKRHSMNRKTECIKGHPLAGENLIVRKNGQRGCRICQRAHDAAFKDNPEIRERLNRQARERRKQRREIAMQAKLTPSLEAPATKPDQSAGERVERMREARQRYQAAVADLAWVAEKVAKGQQFNAYDQSSNDDEDTDEDLEFYIGIGPISDFRFLGECQGRAQKNIIESALRFAALATLTDPMGGVTETVEIPEGWKLVPFEPTEAMVEAAVNYRPLPIEARIRTVWCDMLAASPSSPVSRMEEGS